MKPSQYVLWPKTSFDPDVDDAAQYDAFRTAMLHSYRKGNRIVNVDEPLALSHLGLDNVMIALLTRGRSMGCGLWGNMQKPSHVPLYFFNQCQHLFSGLDLDARNRKRYSEFGGVDPKMIDSAVLSLDEHSLLYLRRRGRVACIVESE
jgi:hypothetical protein